MTSRSPDEDPDRRAPLAPVEGADATGNHESPGNAERGDADRPAPRGRGRLRRARAAPAELDPPRDEATVGTRIWRGLRELVIVVAIALVASTLLRAFVVQAFYVPSTSMLPTIERGDRIVVSRINDVERGEVVVFSDPGGWILDAEAADPPTGLRAALEWVGVMPSSSHEHLVKRVIGLPGDRVVCCDEGGRLTINGADVDESSFIAPPRAADDQSYELVVPAGHLFVLGDNRYRSADSAYHLATAPKGQPNAGFVPMDLVTGRAVGIVWPASDWAWLEIPEAYANVPDGREPPQRAIVDIQGPR